ncbi:EamA family transporter [Metallosphaera tengchongensis]|uniref:EamA family transporter n=1 Tax=Metallosphaera tengchongensis TaxID=1532350 RepID=A0A6N0NTF7_9CREN|nr:EamA family transporter [Metallosphaera tengchongensis]QKQ99192.1 EamA family transporter [Metallosphaera tengchongensis]
MKINKGFNYLTLASVLWGTIGIAVQFSYKAGGNSIGMVGFRTLFSLIVTIFLLDRRMLFRRESIIMGLVSGLFYETYTFAITIDGAPLSSFLLYTAPIFVAVISFGLVKERITSRKVAAIFIVIFALYLEYLGTPTFYQVFWGLMSGLTYGMLISFSKYLQTKDYREIDILGVQSFWSSILVFPLLLLNRDTISLPSLLGGVYLAVLGTIIPYYFFYKGIKYADSTIATVITALEPVVTTILSLPLLGEGLTGYQLIGSVLILLCAIWLSISV